MQSDKRIIRIRRMMNTEKDMNSLLKWLSDPHSTVVACFILVDENPIGYVQYYPIEQDSYKFNDEDTYNAVQYKGEYKCPTKRNFLHTRSHTT